MRTSLALLAALAAAPLAAQERLPVHAANQPLSGAPFTPAIKAGGFVFVSGQLGFPPGSRTLVPGGVGPETRQVLENIRAILEAAGSSLAKTVRCTVYLADVADWPAMNEVYRTFFTEAPPARSAVGTALLAGARVEIDCIALA